MQTYLQKMYEWLIDEMKQDNPALDDCWLFFISEKE
jgi:hypothetical protein